MDRRRFLKLSGAAALLAACDSRGPEGALRLLRYAEKKNRGVERTLYRHHAMDMGSAKAPLAGEALPVYFIADSVPVWDESQRGPWRLEVTGMVKRPLSLTLEQLQSLPRRTQRVNHYCVEGWNAVEEWTGCRVSDLLWAAGGTLLGAQAVDFESFDNSYHESWDLESALHPQTLICYGLDGKPLGPAHGAPARLFSPIKLGYKNTKYLTRVVVLPEPNGGYWSDQGYEWYAGT